MIADINHPPVKKDVRDQFINSEYFRNCQKALGPILVWKFMTLFIASAAFMLFSDIIYLSYTIWDHFPGNSLEVLVSAILQVGGYLFWILSLIGFGARNSQPLPGISVFICFVLFFVSASLHSTQLRGGAWHDHGVVKTVFVLRWIAVFLNMLLVFYVFVKMWNAYIELLRSTDRFAYNLSQMRFVNTSAPASQPVNAAASLTSPMPNNSFADPDTTGLLVQQQAAQDVHQMRIRLNDLARKDFEIQNLRKELFDSHNYITQMNVRQYNEGSGAAALQTEYRDQTFPAASALLEQENSRLRSTVDQLNKRVDALSDPSLGPIATQLAMANEKLVSQEVELASVKRTCQHLQSKEASFAATIKGTEGQFREEMQQQINQYATVAEQKHVALAESNQRLEKANARIAELLGQLQEKEQEQSEALASVESHDEKEMRKAMEEDILEQHRSTFLAMREGVENLRVQLASSEEKLDNAEFKIVALEKELATAKANAAAAPVAAPIAVVAPIAAVAAAPAPVVEAVAMARAAPLATGPVEELTVVTPAQTVVSVVSVDMAASPTEEAVVVSPAPSPLPVPSSSLTSTETTETTETTEPEILASAAAGDDEEGEEVKNNNEEQPMQGVEEDAPAIVNAVPVLENEVVEVVAAVPAEASIKPELVELKNTIDKSADLQDLKAVISKSNSISSESETAAVVNKDEGEKGEEEKGEE